MTYQNLTKHVPVIEKPFPSPYLSNWLHFPSPKKWLFSNEKWFFWGHSWVQSNAPFHGNVQPLSRTMWRIWI